MPIQAIRVAIDDLNISFVPFLSFEASQISQSGSLQERGTVLIHTIQAKGQIPWKCYRCLDSHKIVILLYARFAAKDPAGDTRLLKSIKPSVFHDP